MQRRGGSGSTRPWRAAPPKGIGTSGEWHAGAAAPWQLRARILVALGLAASFVVSVAAFASVGFGLALLIPTIFAMSARLVPENRAGALSFVSLLTALPRTLAPLVFGLVAARLGTPVAFGLVAIGLLASLGLILSFRRTVRRA